MLVQETEFKKGAVKAEVRESGKVFWVIILSNETLECGVLDKGVEVVLVRGIGYVNKGSLSSCQLCGDNKSTFVRAGDSLSISTKKTFVGMINFPSQ